MDTTFLRRLAWLNAAIPALLLGWDAVHHELGANGVNYALHTTGLMGLLLLVLSLAVTPLRRLTGWSEIVAPRRALGLSAFAYLCVHFVVFFAFDRGGSVSSTIHEIVTRRYLQIGTLALLLLVPLALTSTQGMVTRLGPRRWKRLHRLTYVATPLGAIHYFLLVKSDVRQPLVFAGALGVLLIARPVFASFDRREKKARQRRFWSGDMRVERVTDETPDVRTFRLVPADGAARLPFDHRPGQYLTFQLTLDGRRVNRSFTLASSPTQTSSIEVTVKREEHGKVSRYLHEHATPGAVLRLAAPAGRFVFTGAGQNAVVLVAGGVGITPLMAMIRFLTDRRWEGAIHLLVSASTETDLVFRAELAALGQRFPNLHVTTTLSREPAGTSWDGPRGRIDASLLARVLPPDRQTPIYLCGPDAMMQSTRALLRAAGVPEAAIFTEDFTSATTSSIDADASDVYTAPGSAAGSADVADEDAGATVTFTRSGTRATVMPGETLLEAAESAGLDLPFECRSGICGQCKSRLVSGSVSLGVHDALTRDDRAKGLILACQARPRGDVVLDV